jgi:DNA polymerase III alpha subunit
MAFGTLEDSMGTVNLTFWPGTYSKYAEDLKLGNIILLEGKVDTKRQWTFVVSILKVVK